jgi:regulator of protease activity HflC (stomatin/prohibitin superfamily)
MDFWFIMFIIVGVIFLITIPATLLTQEREAKSFARFAFGVAFFLMMFTLFMSSFKIVGAKEIGVPVTFGRPSGEVMHNGWNWKSPPTTVHVFDGALQTERFSNDKDDDGDPVTVRLFTGSTAGVNTTFQWRLENDAKVKQVYLNYREPDKINTNLIKRALQQALNDVYSQYNPYAALIAAQAKAAGDNTPGTQQVATTFEDLQAKALSRLKAELEPQGVSAVTLTIAGINYDQKTQENLNALGTAITQTQIALQNEKTADAQARANQKLNSSTASNATLQQLCIQATQKVLEDGHQLPAGWNCFGASNVAITNK